MNRPAFVMVETAMTWLLTLSVALGLTLPASSQEPAPAQAVRSPEEIPADMPPPPSSAPPAEAPPVEGADEVPPHPETPDPLSEAQPSAEILASTSYHWLPGHWIWTGQHFEWLSGHWIYKVQGMILVPPLWQWDGERWVFHNAGWANPGTYEIIYRPTPAPGGPDVIANVTAPPIASAEAPAPQVTTTTVYVWTGFYVPPPIFFPIWHPWYHYHWFHLHPVYVRPPLYRHPRYTWARTQPPPPRVRPPPAARPPGARPPGARPSGPSTRPTQPSTRPSSPSTRPSSPSTRHSPGGGSRRGR